MQASILNEKNRLDHRFAFNDALNPCVHLVFDAVRCLCNVVDRLSVDAALSDQTVGLKFVDGVPLHFLLQSIVIPVCAQLQGLYYVVLVKNWLLGVWSGLWMHFKKDAAGFIQANDEGGGRLTQPLLEDCQTMSSRLNLSGCERSLRLTWLFF